MAKNSSHYFTQVIAIHAYDLLLLTIALVCKKDQCGLQETEAHTLQEHLREVGYVGIGYVTFFVPRACTGKV